MAVGVAPVTVTHQIEEGHLGPQSGKEGPPAEKASSNILLRARPGHTRLELGPQGAATGGVDAMCGERVGHRTTMKTGSVGGGREIDHSGFATLSKNEGT